jgi:hypothetical protein
MSLLIPDQYKTQINKYSGHFHSKSVYAKKNLKGLFRDPANLRYLCGGLYKLITNVTYVQKNIPVGVQDYNDYQGGGYATGFNNTNQELLNKKTALLVAAFSRPSVAKFLLHNIQDLIEQTDIPYPEDIVVVNPVQQLHALNKSFLVKTSKNIIQSPEMLLPGFNSINPETGKYEGNTEYDFNCESYADGVWRPETLFTNSNRNRNTPYWTETEVNYYSDADGVNGFADGSDQNKLGHRYYSPEYSHSQRTRSQFPRWQYSVDYHRQDHTDPGSLREGGDSDRRTQRPRGYDMSHLTSKSTY